MYLAGEDGCACRFYQKEKTILPRLAPGPPMCRRGVAGERGASEEGLRCKPWECDHSGLADLGGEEPVEQRRCCGTAGSFVRSFRLDTPSISGLLASSVDSFVGIANLRLLRAVGQAIVVATGRFSKSYEKNSHRKNSHRKSSASTTYRYHSETTFQRDDLSARRP